MNTRPNGKVIRFLVVTLGLASLIAMLSSGCARRRTAVVVHHPNATVVTIKAGHTHGARCGHYKHGNRWYHHKGHVHKARCGHKKVRGVWVIK